MPANFRTFSNGVRVEPKATTLADRAGEIDFQTSDAKFYGYNGSVSSAFVTESSIATLSNKTLTNPTVTGTLTVNNTITSGTGNLIVTAVSNSNVNLVSNGTGVINLDSISVKGFTIVGAAGTDLSISTPANLILNPTLVTEIEVAGSLIASVTTAGVVLQAAKALVLNDASTHAISVVAPASVTGSYTITLPATAPASGSVLEYNGTDYVWLATGGSFANTTLSNLSTPTAINQDLLPGTDATVALGSVSERYTNIFASGIAQVASVTVTNGTQSIQLAPQLTAPSTFVGDGLNSVDNIAVYTQTNVAGTSTATSSISIETGNKTAGTGDSGTISLQTGTSAGGARGRVVLNGSAINIGAQGTVDPVSGHTGDIYFNTTAQALKVYNGSLWSPIGSGQFSTTTVTTITSGGTITLGLGGFQMIRVQGTGTGTTQMALAPFGTSAPADGTVVNLVGQSDTAVVQLIPGGGVGFGAMLNGPVSLTKGKVLSLQYDATLNHYLEISRTN